MAHLEFASKKEIMARLGFEPNGKVQNFFTETCYENMDEFVPMDTGDLRRVVTLTPHSITYEQEYAETQYKGIINGYPITNYTTPGTGPYWDERMITAKGDEVVKEVQEFAKRRLNEN